MGRVFSDKFYSSIENRFGVNRQLLHAIIRDRKTTNENVKTWEDLTDGTEMDKIYLHFALSTIVRGRQTRDWMLRECGNPGGRYLDVGCAYGGFVVAFAEAGYQALGVEISKRWAEIGQKATSHLENANVDLRDFYEMEGDNCFSIITCNDVIEHVADPREAISKIARLLVPGGYAYFTIPNRLSVAHVLRDGHYNLTGHALLSHHAAKAYFEHHSTRFDGREYSCGEMYPFDWYIDTLGLAGLVPREVTPAKIDRTKAIDRLSDAKAAIGSGKDFAGCEQILQDEIRMLFADYCGRFHKALTRFDLGLQNTFARDFYADFWHFVAEKPKNG